MKRVITLLALSVLTTWAQEGDPDKGKEISSVCQACHMADGSGQENGAAESWPTLAGFPAQYLEKQLHDIVNGSRISPSMMPFVNMLSEEDMADVSAYYASLPRTYTDVVEPDAELLAQGEKIATRGDWDRYIPPCSACHGPDNQGAGDIFPPLAGQHVGYIRKQLQLWQQDQRQNDVNQLMISVAKRMTDEDIEAVSLWLASQNPQGGQ